MGTDKVPMSKKVAFSLLALLLLIGVMVMRLSPSVKPQVAHASREMAYDLDEQHAPTPQELQRAAAAEQDRQRTVALNKCANEAWHAQQLHPSDPRQESRAVMEIVSACRARIFESNNVPAAHGYMQIVSPGHVETVPMTPPSRGP